MSIEYNGENYESKAEVCRLMYDNGEVKMDADSKKKAAAFLGMTVQTVHATLKKYLEKKGELPASEPRSKKNKSNAVKVATAIEPEFQADDGRDPTDDGDGYDKYSRPKKGQIFITSVPNKYGLPITNPPLEVRTSEYED